MSWLSDTIAGRTIVVLVLGLGSIVTLAQYLYQRGLEHEVTVSNTASVVERLTFMADSMTSLDVEKRDDAAHRMSGGPLELHWGREPLAMAGGSLDETAIRLRDHLLVRSPGLAERLVIGTNRTETDLHASSRMQNDSHVTLMSLPLSDGSWLNVTLARVQTARAGSPSLLLSAVLGALGIVLVSILMSRWLTQPLDQLAAGARRLFLTSEDIRLPEAGTREVRTLASAINDLQARIRTMVNDRTQMLAAISHDLRTPLTRLRLRVDGVTDAETRRSIEADLDEMEEMIDATLAFLRDDLTSEALERVDLAAIVQTIASDAADAGEHVQTSMPRTLVMSGRHLALKRALTNLVQNGVKYGGAVTITGSLDAGTIRISICDEGPGIPADQLERVFEPFLRIETSRGRHTGGHGLGLTVARSIFRAHGGDVRLKTREPRGLEAQVTLPAGTD